MLDTALITDRFKRVDGARNFDPADDDPVVISVNACRASMAVRSAVGSKGSIWFASYAVRSTQARAMRSLTMTWAAALPGNVKGT